MGMPRILPMRKPDPRFISVCAFSVAQDKCGGAIVGREQVAMFEGWEVSAPR
jgi:hypothetical protein